MAEDSIIQVNFTLIGNVKMDTARAAEDPFWESISRRYDTSNALGLRSALKEYIIAYLSRTTVLGDAPWTCGPADITNTTMEIIDDERN